MSRIDHKNMKLQYRHYTVEPDLPLIFWTDEVRPINPFYALNYGCEVRFMHLHNCIEIACIEEDGGEYCHDAAIEPLHKDDVVIIMPYHAHILRQGQGGPKAHYFYFDPMLFMRNFQPEAVSTEAMWGGIHSVSGTILQGEDAAKIRHRVDEIICEMKSGQINSRLCAKGLLLSLTVELTRILGQHFEVEKKTDAVAAIVPVLQYIHTHYNEKINSEKLQDICHLSGTHFRRVFGAVMNCSPLEYIQNLRISNACDLLLSGDRSVLDISMRVGYDSISSFNRQFVKIMGVSPTQWRKTKQLKNYERLPDSVFHGQA